MFGDVKENWAWLLAVGIFFIALGIGALLLLPLVTALTAIVFGAFMIVAGLFELYDAIKHEKGWISRVSNAVLGILYILFGALTFYNPLLGAAAITLAMAATFIAIGIVRMYLAFQNRDDFPQWEWGALLGVVTIILGTLLLIGWPAISVWFLGLYVAIDLIMNGTLLIYLAIAAKNYA